MVDCYNPSLVLVQPRKTCPCLTERLLKGRKESNQTKIIITFHILMFYCHSFLGKPESTKQKLLIFLV